MAGMWPFGQSRAVDQKRSALYVRLGSRYTPRCNGGTSRRHPRARARGHRPGTPRLLHLGGFRCGCDHNLPRGWREGHVSGAPTLLRRLLALLLLDTLPLLLRQNDPVSRGKRSIALDLKSDEGVATLLRLASTADVFVEPFRPGVVEKLGIGPDVLCAANERLIYGRMTG